MYMNQGEGVRTVGLNCTKVTLQETNAYMVDHNYLWDGGSAGVSLIDSKLHSSRLSLADYVDATLLK